jgi:hypothetical protein
MPAAVPSDVMALAQAEGIAEMFPADIVPAPAKTGECVLVRVASAIWETQVAPTASQKSFSLPPACPNVFTQALYIEFDMSEAFIPETPVPVPAPAPATLPTSTVVKAVPMADVADPMPMAVQSGVS